MTLRMGMLNIYQEERRASGQLSDEKGMNNFKNSKYNRYKCKLVLITYKLFIKSPLVLLLSRRQESILKTNNKLTTFGVLIWQIRN